MTSQMTPVLYRAIMAMDAYNRGYAPGLKFGTSNEFYSLDTPGQVQIGNATIIRTNGQTDARSEGFYALAYDLKDAQGVTIERIISYRGTDYLNGDTGLGIGADWSNGYGIGFGTPEVASQGSRAIQFYKDVVNQVYGSGTALNAANLVTLKAIRSAVV